MRPIVNYSLRSADKADIPAEIHKYRFYELCDQYADYCRIYTDGSKVGEQVASAIVYKASPKAYDFQISLASFVLNYMLFSGNRCYSPIKVEKIRNFLRFAI